MLDHLPEDCVILIFYFTRFSKNYSCISKRIQSYLEKYLRQTHFTPYTKGCKNIYYTADLSDKQEITGLIFAYEMNFWMFKSKDKNIFDNLTKLKLNFAVKTNNVIPLPERLTHLILGRQFNTEVIMPKSLTHLYMFNEYYHKKFNLGNLINLKHLAISNRNFPYVDTNGITFHKMESIIVPNLVHYCVTIVEKSPNLKKLILVKDLTLFASNSLFLPKLPKSIEYIQVVASQFTGLDNLYLSGFDVNAHVTIKCIYGNIKKVIYNFKVKSISLMKFKDDNRDLIKVKNIEFIYEENKQNENV